MSSFTESGNCCSLEYRIIMEDENCYDTLVGGTVELQKPWSLLQPKRTGRRGLQLN